jgi:hypothetical protein
MRFMLTFRIPMEKGNKMIKDGTLPETLQTILEDLEPEAAYFSDIEGARGGYLVINMDDASQMPALSEPLFLGLGATIQAHPVMVPEDLERAGADLQQVAQKYG